MHNARQQRQDNKRLKELGIVAEPKNTDIHQQGIYFFSYDASGQKIAIPQQEAPLQDKQIMPKLLHKARKIYIKETFF